MPLPSIGAAGRAPATAAGRRARDATPSAEAGRLTAGGNRGHLSRALGRATLVAGGLLVLRWAATAALLAVPSSLAGVLLAAATLVAGGLLAAPWLRARLAVQPPPPATMPSARAAILGAAAGLGAAVALYGLLLAGGSRPGALAPAPLGGTALYAALAVALAYAQERLMRGAAFDAALPAGGRPAIAITAALTAAVDLLDGMGLLTSLTALLLGLWWGRARLRTGGTAWPIAAHAAWNVALGPLLGLGGEVAAGPGRALLLPHTGPPWWAGPPGAVEAGLASAVVAAAAAALGWLLPPAAARRG